MSKKYSRQLNEWLEKELFFGIKPLELVIGLILLVVALCFARAVIEVKKKYNITARTPISTRWDTYTSLTDALLLEVEPKQVEPK